MTADRWVLRLYEAGRHLGQFAENFDPDDEKRCREILEQLVKKVRGTLNLDLSRWRMEVCHSAGSGYIRLVSVDDSGRTVVTK